MITTLTQKVTLSSDALFQEIDGEMVVLDLKSESYFGLDAVGARIWQLMQELGELSMVFDAMLDEYDVEPDQLEADMMALINELLEAGLITCE